MEHCTVLLFLCISVLLAVFSGRLWVYLLTHLVPRLLPTNWNRVGWGGRRVVLKTTGCEIEAEEKEASSDDPWLLQLLERSLQPVQQLLERSVPIELKRLAVSVNLKELLEQAQKKPSGIANLKESFKTGILTCLQRPLFWMRYKFDVDANTVEISLKDEGMKVILENAKVVYNCKQDVHFQADLETDNLTCSIRQPNQKNFDFVTLFDKADKARFKVSGECSKIWKPALHLLDMKLGTLQVAVNDDLIKEMIEVMTPLQSLLSLMEKPGQLTPFPFLPSEIDGTVQKLSILYEETGIIQVLRFGLLLNRVQLKVKSSASDVKVDVNGRIRALQLEKWMTFGEMERRTSEAPEVKFTASLKAEMDS